jgi:hypothetical protein
VLDQVDDVAVVLGEDRGGDQEGVQRVAVAGGVDLGVEDAEALASK